MNKLNELVELDPCSRFVLALALAFELKHLYIGGVQWTHGLLVRDCSVCKRKLIKDNEEFCRVHSYQFKSSKSAEWWGLDSICDDCHAHVKHRIKFDEETEIT